MLLIAGLAPLAQAQEQVSGVYRGLMQVVRFDVSPPLRDIPPVVDPMTRRSDDPDLPPFELGPQDVDPIVQDWTGGPEMIPAPLISFDGQANSGGYTPPDPVGDVGPSHYVAMANVRFQIFDKAGNSLYGPANNNTLWSGFGGACQNENMGDPIVLYDQIADRWMLTQFTANGPTYYNCVAVSTTGDPTGSYYRWAVSTGTNFPDYPKYGIWTDAYYIATREFAGGSSYTGVGVYALERADIIAGNPTPTIISFFVPRSPQYIVGDGLLPADLDGFALPPAGSPEYFVGSQDQGGPYGAPQDALNLWKFDADFTTPSNSTFTMTNTLPIAVYDTMFPCGSGRQCIPQPGTSVKVDILSYRQRPLHRLAYRNFGTHEAMVTNQSVEAAANMAGIRWWEIRSPNSSPVIYQEGTYAPGVSDGIHRWMGSIAQDSAGNMALGYSASASSVTYPSSWYTGRLAGDPPGTMPQGEGSFINGGGSQLENSYNRWGDYTSMNVDPVDDCTFWYINQYYPTTSTSNWRLRIGAFKFNECGTPDFYLGASPDTNVICAGVDATYGINVGSVAGFGNVVSLSASGNPAGSTADFSLNPVTPPGSSVLTIGNTGGVAGGSYVMTVSGTADGSAGHSIDVVLDVVPGVPAAPTLSSPPDGATSQPLRPQFVWSSVTGSDAYWLEVDDDADFSSTVISEPGLTGTTYTPTADLAESTTYYWRVSSENLCGAGAASTVFSFTTLSSLPFEDGFESGDTSAWSSTLP
ncbi:MAG: hypothetical protein C3F15_17750 [Holophagae bacterium]|nr:MAG: hypothetical protein C3F15_17750 [Holophagae bacterium]